MHTRLKSKFKVFPIAYLSILDLNTATDHEKLAYFTEI